MRQPLVGAAGLALAAVLVLCVVAACSAQSAGSPAGWATFAFDRMRR